MIYTIRNQADLDAALAATPKGANLRFEGAVSRIVAPLDTVFGSVECAAGATFKGDAWFGGATLKAAGMLPTPPVQAIARGRCE